MSETYENGRLVKIGDYVRVSRPEHKSWWGWVKSFPSEGLVELLDKKGKTRHAATSECSKSVKTRMNKLNKQTMENIIEGISDAAKRSRR